ncbi:twin-arginine translocase TatA/TatE family subunit [Atopomonas sediminilitoris]|uniref:twin-arginine translocase TatA/TatE family subunit n=1 Tax=Atopomonas sediminilitoris TaxID=2919919 RepID=UPI001F4E77C4|nr:twin-arginine translocase TatA/TatE family subunit [Atopomonas sediminilitoris]MCJ8168143.1 twin-arginine translocase TatA/TatE family subunit [Atopomonas sediminilitoris]
MAIGPWQIVIILLIVVLLFGTSRLKTLGSDVGGAIKGLRGALNSDDDAAKKS